MRLLWIERNRPAIWRSQHNFDGCRALNSRENVHSPYWMVVHFSAHWMCCSFQLPHWLALYLDATILTNDPCPMTWYDCRAYQNQHSALHRDALRRRQISQRTHPIWCSTSATNDLCLPTTANAVSSDWILTRWWHAHGQRSVCCWWVMLSW